SQFRFQLARDSGFSDIVVDRVVTGTGTEVSHLEPGKYFWRVAPLTGTLGGFSLPQAISALRINKTDAVRQRTVKPQPSERPVSTPLAEESTTPKPNLPAPILASRVGWQAGIGNVAHPAVAHLRASNRSEVVGVNSDGFAFALDAE